MIQRKYLHSKLHGLVVTEAHLHYEGSIVIPKTLLEVSGIHPGEAINLWNVTSGSRLETYVLEGEQNGYVSVNGAAAHHFSSGDVVIAACFAWSDSLVTPRVVFINSDNSVKEVRGERLPGSGASN